MIGWLKGKIIDQWMISSRKGLTISCSGVGYEVQLLPRNIEGTRQEQEITLWIHQVYRDDGIIMFGFIERSERDLFRKLIEVSGIGPQIAISLLEVYKYIELIEAINAEEIGKLTQVPGIGRRIAERLTVELRGKLSIPNKENNTSKYFYINDPLIGDLIQKEVINILRELEYDDTEITQALKEVDHNLYLQKKSFKTGSSTQKEEIVDTFLKQALIHLSQEVSSKGA